MIKISIVLSGNQSTDSTSGSIVSECWLGNGTGRGLKSVSFIS